MPRKSTAALSIVPPVNVGLVRLSPPGYLSKDEQRVFRAIVGACEPHHFTPADMPLVVEYSRACVLGDCAAVQLAENGAVIEGKMSAWLTVQEKAQRALVALAARLRVCPQSRFDRTVAGARSRPVDEEERPWEPAAAH